MKGMTLPIFSAHVALMSPEFQPVAFAPGDAVPAWAADQVGDHCLDLTDKAAAEPESEPEPSEVEDADAEDAEDAPAPEVEHPKPTTTPDFTSAAPRRGRPRK